MFRVKCFSHFIKLLILGDAEGGIKAKKGRNFLRLKFLY